MVKTFLTLVFLCVGMTVSAKTLIHAGYLFNAENGTIEPQMSIVIVEDRVANVLEGYVNPEPDDIYIDLTGYYILPGLIDMHVHLSNESSRNAYLERVTWNAADYAIRATKNAESTLIAGFTTVRNL